MNRQSTESSVASSLDGAERFQGEAEPEGLDLDVWKLAQSLWKGRRTILLALVGTLLLYGVVLTLCLCLRPGLYIASIDYLLTFDGAAAMKYPSGAAFAPEDVVAPPVLEAVFQANQIGRYVSFATFSNAFSITSSPRDADFLASEYNSRFADRDMNQVARQALISAFDKRYAEMLAEPRYSLTYRTAFRFRRIPPLLIEKAMLEILSTWAQQAEERKGAIKYDIAVFSRNLAKNANLGSEEYLVSADILRSLISRLLVNLEQFNRLPGVALVRAGESNGSAAELRSKLQDLLRFQVQPLVWDLIQHRGLVRNPARLRSYAESRLSQAKLERMAAEKRLAALRDSLRDYMNGPAARSAGVPPGGPEAGGTPDELARDTLGASFFDRLLDLYDRGTDRLYRQRVTDRVLAESIALAALEKEMAYYGDLARLVPNTAPASDDRGALTADQDVEGRLEAAERTVEKYIDEMDAIYSDLASMNVHAPTLLYRIVRPLNLEAEPAVSPRDQRYGWILSGFLGLGAGVAVVLWRHVRQRREGREATAHSETGTQDSAAASSGLGRGGR
jgi:hypothetical protein